MDTSPHTVHCVYIGISTYIMSIEMYNSLRSHQDTKPDAYWHGTCLQSQCRNPLPVHHCDSVRVRVWTERCSQHSLTVHYKNSPNRQQRHKWTFIWGSGDQLLRVKSHSFCVTTTPGIYGYLSNIATTVSQHISYIQYIYTEHTQSSICIFLCFRVCTLYHRLYEHIKYMFWT